LLTIFVQLCSEGTPAMVPVTPRMLTPLAILLATKFVSLLERVALSQQAAVLPVEHCGCSKGVHADPLQKVMLPLL
jgi:hypothetical protein